MELKLHIRNTENIGELTDDQVRSVEEIVTALITSGGLTGVRGGQTIIHFDKIGEFQRIEFRYFPWVRRRIDRGRQ